MNSRAMGSGCGSGCLGIIFGIVLTIFGLFVVVDLLVGESTDNYKDSSQENVGLDNNKVNGEPISSFSSQETQNSVDEGSSNVVVEPEVAEDTVSQEANTNKVKVYGNCTDMRVDYPNGVYKGDPVYEANPSKDRDGDGRACEPDGE